MPKNPKKKPKPGELGSGTLAANEPIEEPGVSPDEAGDAEGVSSIIDALRARDILLFAEKKSAIPALSENFYEYSVNGVHCKIPVRVESIGAQSIPNYKQISYGHPWACDGTVATTYDPISGIQELLTAISTYADGTYVPLWDGDYGGFPAYPLSLGGQMWHALEMNIRSHKHISSADMLIIVQALEMYLSMALAIMLFTSYYNCHLDGYINMALNNMYADDSQAVPLFTGGRNELRTRLLQTISENWFPYPFFNFWKNRFSACIPKQYGWYKYFLTIPYIEVRYYETLCRVFDAYDQTGQQWTHPETLLRDNDLWDAFTQNLLPLLWGLGSKGTQPWMYGNYESYLKSIGWQPIDYNAVRLQYIQKAFWTHPFDELLGVGLDKCPQNHEDEDIPIIDWIYGDGFLAANDANAAATLVKYLYPDAFRVQYGDMPFASPHLDLAYLISSVNVINYASAANAVPEHGAGATLRGSLNYDGDVWTELDYDEYMWFFPDHFWRTTEIDSVKPDPDIQLNGVAGEKHRFLIEQDKAYCVPFKMPPMHWMHPGISGVRRKMDVQWSIFFGIGLDDIEIFKQQRLLPRAGATGSQF